MSTVTENERIAREIEKLIRAWEQAKPGLDARDAYYALGDFLRANTKDQGFNNWEIDSLIPRAKKFLASLSAPPPRQDGEDDLVARLQVKETQIENQKVLVANALRRAMDAEHERDRYREQVEGMKKKLAAFEAVCPECKGNGVVTVVIPMHGERDILKRQTCRSCKGTGRSALAAGGNND